MSDLPTPFHDGELALQDKFGVRDKVHAYAPRVIRSFMPDQHREFYSALPYFFMSSVDKDGMPWASVLWGASGFIGSPSPTMLTVNSLPLANDPLFASLTEGTEIGMVGLQFHTRRRNRVNGRISSSHDHGFSIEITQSFGNCPQYIQGREINDYIRSDYPESPAELRGTVNEADIKLIEQADTFFIASAAKSLGSDERHGADMSHRGGEPGFVKILEDGSVIFPDFKGNNHYNTLGNIHSNPVAGLLFVDFETGDVLQLSGQAEIVWPENTPYRYDDALRYVKITPSKIIRHLGVVPYDFSAPDMSPFVPYQARWTRAGELPSLTAAQSYAEIVDVVDEADGIKSFYIRPETAEIAAHKPGQHLPISLVVGGEVLRRTYTLSSAALPNAYRITVKREEKGSVSKYLHDDIRIGDKIIIATPGGAFTLQDTDAPVVLLSAGVGITPMMAMAETLLNQGPTKRPFHFFHGSRKPHQTAFLNEMRRWQQQYTSVDVAVRLSKVADRDVKNIPNASAGYVDAAWLKRQKLPKNAEYYMCGPAGFMQAVYDFLISNGVDDNQIYFEAFGPSSLKRNNVVVKNYSKKNVEFSASKKEAVWDASAGTLLELAEEKGIEAAFSCRSGSCGSCAVGLLKGKVEYEETPAYPVEKNEVLLCCAAPSSDENEDTLVLDI